jgi:flagellar protein FlgJ
MNGISGFNGIGQTQALAGAEKSMAAAVGAIASAAESDAFESMLRSAVNEKNEAELKNACVQFEELMLGILYKSMKATIQRSEIMPPAPGRDIYEQWQDDALMKKIAERGTFGLADMMYRQLSYRMKNAYELVDEI